MGKKRCAIEADYVRLTVKIELTDTYPFTATDFEVFVSSSVKRVLGTCGPQVQIGGFDEFTRKGSVIVAGEDAQLVWASLTISGQYNGRAIAAHFFSLTEFEAEPDFVLTPVF